MSKTFKPSEPGARSRSNSRRPFDAVVIALSASLLVIFGVVIGRFIVTNQAVEVVDHFDEELSALRSQVVDLKRQLLRAESQSSVAETQAANAQRQAEQLKLHLEQIEMRHNAVRTAIASVLEQRATCLHDVQEYAALDQGVPPLEVLRFAEAMFDVQNQTLHQLTDVQPATLSMPTALRFSPVSARTVETMSTPVTQTAASVAANSVKAESPALPAPTASQASEFGTTKPASPQTSEYFTPAQGRRTRARYTFFAPRRDSQSQTMPRRSGITFHDTADLDESTVRR